VATAKKRRETYVTRATRYARRVVSGEIPACKWVRLACKRQLDDLSRWKAKDAPYTFDEDAASRPCFFIENLQHVKGPLARAGENIRLEDWQCFILTTVFGWIDRKTGFRRYRRVYDEMPRGNAKSTLSSGVGLYMLAADGEEGGELYSAATKKDQAKIVLGDAQQMARKAHGMRKTFGVEVSAGAIHVQETNSKFTALSSDEDGLDGLNIFFACIDELHAHKTRAVYDAIETGTGKRDTSLLWVITTSGFDRSGICYEIRTYATKVLEGLFVDETQFAIIYTIDDDDDPLDEASLPKANPNWNVSVRPSVVVPLQTKARVTPSARSNFFTKHLCVWCASDSAWMQPANWEKCANPKLRIDDFVDDECVIGLDLASKVDITAKVKVFRRRHAGKNRFFIFPKFYLPQRALDESRNSQYEGWHRAGHIEVQVGDVIDFDEIENDLRTDRIQTKKLKAVAFDPWQATQLASHLLADRVPMVEVRMTVQNLSEPMKEFEAAILAGEVEHDANPVMAWMMSNVVCHRDKKDNVFPNKEADANKIDGPVAAMLAINRFIADQTKPSVYANRGVLTA
jgi:phage terminase large subunit-like protein